MTAARPQHYQRQLLLVLGLFLISQLTFALHNHDFSLHPVDADACLVCLVANSDDPAPTSATPDHQYSRETTQTGPVFVDLVSQALLTPSQPRAPPLLLIWF